MPTDEIIKTLATNHSIGGGAGGLVRSLSKQEAWRRVLVATFIGAVSATYLAPFFVWTASRYLGITEADEMSAAMNGAVSFCVGMVSISLSGLIEMIVDRISKKELEE